MPRGKDWSPMSRVASYLSGGIDSCAVLGLAQQEMDRPIRAFTLTFENPLYDEASVAEAQAKHVGATYHPIPITGREIADSFADAIWHAETQMFNGHGVAKYLLSRAVRAAGIKVVFTGEGADEMLGGYPYFRVDALNDNAALSAGEKAALLGEMLGANAATRALLMPEQVDSPEMQAVQRRLGATDDAQYGREVWIHAVDLDNGAQFGDFPDAVLESLLADIIGAWRRREVGTDLVLEVTGSEPVLVGERGGVSVRRSLPALVRWAAGRGAVEVSSDGELPPAPRWL